MPLFWYTPLEIYALFLSIEVPDRRFLKSRPHLSVRADNTEQIDAPTKRTTNGQSVGASGARASDWSVNRASLGAGVGEELADVDVNFVVKAAAASRFERQNAEDGEEAANVRPPKAVEEVEHPLDVPEKSPQARPVRFRQRYLQRHQRRGETELEVGLG